MEELCPLSLQLFIPGQTLSRVGHPPVPHPAPSEFRVRWESSVNLRGENDAPVHFEECMLMLLSSQCWCAVGHMATSTPKTNNYLGAPISITNL